jgi:hypothetical protein
MAQSLVKLTLESNEYERNIRQAQKSWNQFVNGIGLSTQKITAVGAAIGAVTGALKVAKDAFLKNEQQLDDWNRTVESATSIYNGFLNSLNNGDISGFLSNISTITEAAKAAYNALDDLGTFNAFNQINTQRTRTGMTEAIAGFRTGQVSKSDVKAAAEAYKKELQERQRLEQEAYTQQVRKIAAERGVPWGNLEQALTGKYGDYQKLKSVQPTGERMVTRGGGMFTSTSYIEKYAVTAEEKMGEALRSLNDTELQHLQSLGAQAQRTGEEIAQIDKQLARVLNGKQGGTTTIGGGGGGRRRTKTGPSQKDLDAKILGQWQMVELKSQSFAVKGEDTGPSEVFKAITQGAEESTNSIQKLIDAFEALNAKDGIVATELPAVGKDIAKSWSTASQAISGVGNVLANIDDPAAKVLSIIAQAVATVASGAAQAMAAKDTTASGYAWIGAAAAIAAEMAAIISTIHSSTGFAQGGVVPGNSFSGDNTLIRANAQEVVLTRAMAGNLASQLEGVGLQNLNLSATISGEQIRLALNNNGRRTGRGEYVTTNFT